MNAFRFEGAEISKFSFLPNTNSALFILCRFVSNHSDSPTAPVLMTWFRGFLYPVWSPPSFTGEPRATSPAQALPWQLAEWRVWRREGARCV